MTRTRKEVSSQLHSPQSLGNCVKRIDELLVAARRVATEMERLETGPIFIGNQPSFECAMADLSRWGKACEDAYTAKLKDVGHFKAETGTPPPRPVAPAAKPAAKAGKAKKAPKKSR